MSKGTIQVICGNGQGKTAAAVGWALTRTEHEKNIIMIQFLKGNQTGRFHLLKRLEPEMRIFSFERREECFGSLAPEERKEETANIQNGLNYAKKVMVTGECDVLILDEVLRLIEFGIIDSSMLKGILQQKNEEMELILTGRVLPEELRPLADVITCLETQSPACAVSAASVSEAEKSQG